MLYEYFCISEHLAKVYIEKQLLRDRVQHAVTSNPLSPLSCRQKEVKASSWQHVDRA